MAFMISGRIDYYALIGLLAAVTIILIGKYFFSRRDKR